MEWAELLIDFMRMIKSSVNFIVTYCRNGEANLVQGKPKAFDNYPLEENFSSGNDNDYARDLLGPSRRFPLRDIKIAPSSKNVKSNFDGQSMLDNKAFYPSSLNPLGILKRNVLQSLFPG